MLRSALEQCKQEACLDVLQNVVPYLPPNPSHRGGSPVVPTLLDLGDKEIASAYQPKEDLNGFDPAVPWLKKYRLAYTKEEIDAITVSHCYTGRRDENLQEQTRLGVTHSQPVIWKFKVSRHFGLLQNVTDVDVPYSLKRNKALYRGRLSGIHKVGWGDYV